MMKFSFYTFAFLVTTPLFSASESKATVPSASNSLMSVGVALLFILLVIFACAWLLRKLSGQNLGRNSLIKLKSSFMLGAKERLIVVEVDGKVLLLGVTAQNISKIEELSTDCLEQSESAQRPTFQEAFKSQLKKAMGKSDDV